jgi:hypothetical protein
MIKINWFENQSSLLSQTNVVFPKAPKYFHYFIDLFSLDLYTVAKGELKLTFPKFPVSFFSPFLKEMRKIFEKKNNIS